MHRSSVAGQLTVPRLMVVVLLAVPFTLGMVVLPF